MGRLYVENRFVATGRAKCTCCGKKIEKGTICVKIGGWRTSAQCHHNCNAFVELVEQVKEVVKKWGLICI